MARSATRVNTDGTAALIIEMSLRAAAAPTVSTNGVSQWALAAYQNLALIPEALETAAAQRRP